MTFEEALEKFEKEIGKVSSRSEAEWFYIKGQLDLQEAELRMKGLI